MTHWFLFALVGPILWSIVNHIDKHILSNYSEGKGVGAILVFSCLSSVFVLPLIFVMEYQELGQVTGNALLSLLLIGFMSATAFYFYLKAMDSEEASVVVPMFQLIPVFGYVLGYTILDEVLNTMQMVSCLVIISGIIIISINTEERNKISVKKQTLVYATMSSFLFALHDTLFKKIALVESFWVATFWQYLGICLFGLALILLKKEFRNDLQYMFQGSARKMIALNVMSEVLYVAGNLANNFATMLAPIALVLVVSSYQSVFVLLGSLILAVFVPSLAREHISRLALIQKCISIVLIIIGSYFLYNS